MRIGVLDIGSNTGHLLVVDGHRGGPPRSASSFKEPLRLAEHLDDQQAISDEGVARLVEYVRAASAEADDRGCETLLAFATSAVRDAVNAQDVLDRVNVETGVGLQVLSGEDEARLTFLAARRWCGWSAGRLGVFDIGGGSLELAVGSEEVPDDARSLPLGAARLTRAWHLAGTTPQQAKDEVRAALLPVVDPLLAGGGFDRAVATSKTFRSLARICGAAPSSRGPHVRRVLRRGNLAPLVDHVATMTPDDVARLPGVSADRAHQIHAGAVVAEATMSLFGLDELEICPWALREGVLLEHLDHL